MNKYNFSHYQSNDIFEKTWIWWTLSLHVLVWVTAHGIADTNLDAYADMLESFAWGQEWSWGHAKHPPLFAWVTGAWFKAFPRLDLAYHLLSYTNVVIGLLGVYRLAQLMGHPELALASVILLSMSFPYSTLAVKFNANAILLSVWPWVAVAWQQSIRTPKRLGLMESVGLGLLAALAMLGKYYSGVLLLALFLATLSSGQGRQWLISPKPWLSLSVFLVIMLPHLNWLRSHEFVTLHYVSEQSGTPSAKWPMLLKFAIAPIAYWLIPWLLCTGLFVPKELSWNRALITWPARIVRSWKPNGWSDTLFWLASLPWAVTLAFGISGFVELSLPWAIPIGFGFSLLWLRNLKKDSKSFAQAMERLIYALKIWWLVVVLVSPWYAWHQAQQGDENYYLPRREAATALLQTWRERHPDTPLEWVGGQWAENALLAFYGAPELRVIPGVPNEFPAIVTPLANWQKRAGLLLCPLGPGTGSNASHSECPMHMRAWLQTQGQATAPIIITVQSVGIRFPQTRPFTYMAFEYLPLKP